MSYNIKTQNLCVRNDERRIVQQIKKTPTVVKLEQQLFSKNLTLIAIPKQWIFLDCPVKAKIRTEDLSGNLIFLDQMFNSIFVERAVNEKRGVHLPR